MTEEKRVGYSDKKYAFVGVLAIIYGAISYMIDVMGWQPYMAWIVGGVILFLIAWAKEAKKIS